MKNVIDFWREILNALQICTTSNSRRYNGSIFVLPLSLSLSLLQCDQIGLLLKKIGHRFSNKICPNVGQLFVLFTKSIFLRKKLLWPLLGNFGEDWATINSRVWSHCSYLSQIFLVIKYLHVRTLVKKHRSL